MFLDTAIDIVTNRLNDKIKRLELDKDVLCIEYGKLLVKKELTKVYDSGDSSARYGYKRDIDKHTRVLRNLKNIIDILGRLGRDKTDEDKFLLPTDL